MALVRRVSFRRTREQNTRKLSRDAQVQLNGKPQLVVVSDGRKAQGLLANDVTIRPTSNGVAIGVADGHGNTNETFLSRTQFSNQKAPQSGSGPPTTTQFPNNGDFGWYTDTSSSKNYFVINLSGTITNITISTFSGSITFAQHGNLSGAGTAHSFPDISGTITDTQHGSRGNGSLHSAATTSVNGFMLSTDKLKLDNATNAATASTLALRDGSGNIVFATVNATANYQVAGTKVVDNRVTGWGAPSGTISRAALTLTANPVYNQADTDTVIQAVKAIITDLRAHGLIGT